MPKSNIQRIGSCWKNSLFLTLISLFLLTCISAFVLEMTSQPLWNYEYSKYIYLLGSFILTGIIIFDLIYFGKLQKIKIKGVDVNFDVPHNTSILNFFIDEIIYFFAKTKVAIVIIEDLDRFANLDYFSKLRELNFIINNSEMVKQKVTFVYAVGDTMFDSSEDRAKFFEYIISLTPQMSSSNTKDLIVTTLKEVCDDTQQLPSDFVQELSLFITERRVLNNTINDYKLYYEILGIDKFNDNNKNTKLFSLMVYKNLYPEDFAQLQFGDGVMANAFQTIAKKKVLKIQKEKEEIEKLKKLLSAQKHELIKSMDILKGYIAVIIYKHGNGSGNSSTIIYDSDITNLNDDSYYSVPLYSSRYSLRNMKFTDIKKHLGFDYASKINEINEIQNNTQEDTERKTSEKLKLISEISNMSLLEFCEHYSSVELSSIVDNEIIQLLLLNGFIEEDYMDYISHIGADIINEHDKKISKLISKKEIPNANEPIDNPINLALSIVSSRFESQYVLYFDLVEAVLSDNHNVKLI